MAKHMFGPLSGRVSHFSSDSRRPAGNAFPLLTVGANGVARKWAPHSYFRKSHLTSATLYTTRI